MEMGDFREEDFASKFNQKLSTFGWLIEIGRVYFSEEQNNQKSNDKIKKKENLIREKAMKKPTEEIIDEPKKHRSSSDDGDGPPTRLMHSAIDSMTNPNSLKRNRQKNNNIDDDFDWEYCKKKKQMEMNNVVMKKGKAGGSNYKITTQVSPPHHHLHQSYPCELPQEFKREIERLNGRNVGLVIEKELTITDLNYVTHNRMSMPLMQMVSSTDFLSDDETKLLNEEGGVLRVQLIDPNLVQRDINLKRWVMRKGDEGSQKKPSISYVLRTQWGDVVKANKEVIQAGNIVQVWSFRVNHELYLALVVVGNKEKKTGSDQKESRDNKSSVVDDGESSQGGGTNEADVMQQAATVAAGGEYGNASGGSSTVTTNGWS